MHCLVLIIEIYLILLDEYSHGGICEYTVSLIFVDYAVSSISILCAPLPSQSNLAKGIMVSALALDVNVFIFAVENTHYIRSIECIELFCNSLQPVFVSKFHELFATITMLNLILVIVVTAQLVSRDSADFRGDWRRDDVADGESIFGQIVSVTVPSVELNTLNLLFLFGAIAECRHQISQVEKH